MIKKIDFRKLLLFSLIIAAICILKNLCIESTDSEHYVYFVRQILIFWDQSQFMNLIWLLPIMLSIQIIARKYYFEMQNFDTRYSNRNRYINRLLIRCGLFSIIFNFLIAILQVIVLTLIKNVSITINIEIITILIQYVFECTFLNIIIIFVSMNIKNFMYTYIIFLIFIIVSLTSIVNLGLIEGSSYLPFINMYFNNKINIVSVLLSILTLFFIKKKYLKYDILGGID